MAQSVGHSPLASREFFQKTLDSLRAHIAILNGDGGIVAVNAAWNHFARSHGLVEEFCGPGANYLRACDRATGECSEEAGEVADGIRGVVAGRGEDFYLEYPCHSPTERRWFSVRVTRFVIDDEIRVVVTHDNITRRKLAEIQVIESNRLLGLQANTDALTGLSNRRAFDRDIEREWKAHGRARSPLTVALLDVDCFKQYNDNEGHLAGDDCLRSVARAIGAGLRRDGDLAARYGGEEFAVILPHTPAEDGSGVLLRVLESARALAIPHPTSKVGRGIVTLSVGVATTIPEGADPLAPFLDRADKALYEAKSLGRDRLVESPTAT